MRPRASSILISRIADSKCLCLTPTVFFTREAKLWVGSRLWREAYFEFRDEIENCLLSVSCLETRTRFCPPNLEPRDEIENFVHRISGLETRSRILFPKSRNSRRDRDFSIILPKHISQKKDFSHKRSNITVQLEEEGS